MHRLFGVMILVGLGSAFFPKPAMITPEAQRIHRQFLDDKAGLHAQLLQLTQYVQTEAPADSVRQAFIRSRLAYKRIEWLLAYFQPFLDGHVNGPPVAEVEVDEPGQRVIRPTGLQVVETYLYPAYNRTQKDSLLYELNRLTTYSGRLDQGVPEALLTDAEVWAAAREALFRCLALGITGYDTPAVKTSLPEAAVVLQTLNQALLGYTQKLPQPLQRQMNRQWEGAIAVLQEAGADSTFDRVGFVRDQLYPLCRSLQQARTALGIAGPASSRFLAPEVATLSDSGAFRPNYLINFGAFTSTPQKVALGRVLFFDPLLSGNNARSCASCHQPERAFTDGRAKSRAFQRMKQVLRNAPTLLNSGLQNVQFFDSRVKYLEDQAHDVLNNTHEMSALPDELVRKIAYSKQYRTWFGNAFPDGITPANVRNALACYVRSLNSLNARPDRYLRGENVALSDAERLGFNLFLGKARCATCHFFPIYNGFVPPQYEKVESEIVGVPKHPKTQNATLDPDPGRYMAFRKDGHRYAFKVPTVRNVALTAPYMHNGSFKTLEQVVDFYNRGGGRGIGISLDTQTLPEQPLNLSPVEQTALVAFMNALTDTTGLTHRPDQLPFLEGNRKLNRRKPGGRY